MKVKYAIILCLIITSYQTGKTIGSDNPRIPNIYSDDQVIEDLWGFAEIINWEEPDEINRGCGFTNLIFLESIIPEQHHIRLRNWFNENRYRLGRGRKLYKSEFNEMIRILMDAESRRALLRALRIDPNVHNTEQVIEDLWGFAEIKDNSEPFEIDRGSGYTNLTFLETIIPPTYHIELRNWFSANGHLLGEGGKLYIPEFREMMKTIMTAGSRLILLNALRD